MNSDQASCCDCSIKYRKRFERSRPDFVDEDGLRVCGLCERPLPPGYVDDPGLRWDGVAFSRWDGQSWVFDRKGGVEGNRVPLPAGGQPNAVAAAFAHLGNLALPIVPALVLRQTLGRDDAFVRHHATEAINYAITYLATLVIGFGAFVGCALAGLGDLAIVPWLILVFAVICFVTQTLWAAVRAAQNQWFTYALSLRLVSGAYDA